MMKDKEILKDLPKMRFGMRCKDSDIFRIEIMNAWLEELGYKVYKTK